MSLQELNKLYKLKKAEVFYKAVLQSIDSIQDTSSANLSKFKFQLNTNFEPFKGICLVEVEKIILDQYTQVATQGQVFVRLTPNQFYSADSARNMNTSSVIEVIPITGSATTTYVVEPSYGACVMNIDQNLELSLTDENNGNIDSSDYTNLIVVLRIYPLRQQDS